MHYVKIENQIIFMFQANSTQLNLTDCKNNCNNINVNDREELFCQ